MALIILGRSKCAICDVVLTSADEIRATCSGVLVPRDHPLWRFCDAGVHQECFAQWPLREEFCRLKLAREWENEVWVPDSHCVFRSDSGFVSVETDMEPPTVNVIWIDDYCEVALADWERWLRNEDVLDDYDGLDRKGLEAIRTALRRYLPTVDAIWATLAEDRPDKRAAQAALDARDQRLLVHQDPGVRKLADELDRRHARFTALLVLMQRSGVECPYCGSRSKELRATAALILVCATCGRSSGLDDFSELPASA